MSTDTRARVDTYGEPVEASSQPTPSTPRRRAAASMMSPTDIKPSSPAARRMSQSSTPQAAATPESILDRVLDRPVLIMAGVVSSVVLTGTMYSLVYSSALNTSINSHLPERASYFARKSNIFNQLFVKRAWFWTTLVYLAHLFTAPSHASYSLFSIQSFAKNGRGSRLVAWVVATMCWVVFTSWFFGAGLGDRIIQLSGGTCAIAVPREWGTGKDLLNSRLPDEFKDQVISGAVAGQLEQLYLPVPAALCAGRSPLTPTSHPELFSVFGSSSPTGSRPLTPRWFKGFDISGHVFLLTLASLLLVRELVPSWKAWLQNKAQTEMSRRPIAQLTADRKPGKEDDASVTRQIHRYTTIFGTLLLGLWVWMLLMTSVWFHNPPEKFSGLAVGLLASGSVNVLTPAYRSTSSRQGLGRSPSLLGENENAARRGQTIDNGVILEEFEEEDQPHRLPTRQKVE